MLLPQDPELQKMLPEEDPRQELVERLIEHERFKNAAEMLQQKRLVEEAVWSNPQIQKYLAEDEGPALAVTIFDLVKTLQLVLERTKNRPTYDVGEDDVSVPDMMQMVWQQMGQADGQELVSASRLFERQRSARGMICLFLAILELVKRQAVELMQGEAFGEIALRRGAGFGDAQRTPEDLAAVEEEYR
jgi:segregation and condensation protein A